MTSPRTGHILLVEDEPSFRKLCAGWLRTLGHQVTESATPQEALAHGNPVDLVLLDLVMPPDYSVEAGLERISHFRQAPVIVLTGHADRENALLAIQKGAWDFLGKPLDPDLLRIVIDRALEKNSLEKELRQLRARQAGEDDMGLVGRSPALSALRELIRRIAPTEIRVMILGASGTGKELAARALHQLSPRRNAPFVAVHCGAIPEELLESELFGHLKGSFTGADRNRIGVLEAAHQGTLFLDEIGEMSLTMQVKLLRFLQEGQFRPVGSSTDLKADVRVVCATHRDLTAMVAAGTFREDLFYRLKGVILRMPGLQERLEDIPLLSQTFLNRLAHGQMYYALSPLALNWLLEHPWQGNVRELQQLLQTAASLANPAASPILIQPEDLQFAHGGQPNQTMDLSSSLQLTPQVARLEKRLILTALQQTGGNASQAAKLLGISRVGLWKMMKRLDIQTG
ncbi:MAG: sigma-54-dependent Fis family transcriptional regulator [Magnetococcales bacterium]|nr:sigma-54-dependent Fis family transcriptional regulator [Magnetococcales bacterium]NGZ26999.1 sigma-54-dependent Fis family transcriptional regulator [Magnetococcales bacterium]